MASTACISVTVSLAASSCWLFSSSSLRLSPSTCGTVNTASREQTPTCRGWSNVISWVWGNVTEGAGGAAEAGPVAELERAGVKGMEEPEGMACCSMGANICPIGLARISPGRARMWAGMPRPTRNWAVSSLKLLQLCRNKS